MSQEWLQADNVGDVLVRGRFVVVRALPARQVPNLKATAAADEGDLTFEADSFAKFLRQNQSSLAIRRAVLRAGMKLAKENAAIARGNIRVRLDREVHTRKLLRRHDHQKLIVRLRKKDELLGVTTTPARRDGDAIFLVDEMAEFTGVEELGWRRRFHARVEENSTILTHFPPLLTTSPSGG